MKNIVLAFVLGSILLLANQVLTVLPQLTIPVYFLVIVFSGISLLIWGFF